MLFSSEALLLSGRDDVTVHQEGGSAIVVIRRYAENIQLIKSVVALIPGVTLSTRPQLLVPAKKKQQANMWI